MAANLSKPAPDFSEAELGAVPELDLHGRRSEEVHWLVDDFVAESAVGGWRACRIVHGRGDGRLRAAVQRLLAGNRQVAAFADSALPDRAGGVTLVLLA